MFCMHLANVPPQVVIASERLPACVELAIRHWAAEACGVWSNGLGSIRMSTNHGVLPMLECSQMSVVVALDV